MDDGQKSIISISSRPSITSETDVNEIPASCAVNDIVEIEESSASISKAEEDLDDVFLPVLESTRVESLGDECSPPHSNNPYETAEEITPETEPSSEATELPKESSPAMSLELIKPPILSTKPERIRPRSLGGKQDLDLPKKPIIIPDPASGTVRVNDTTVVMRKKTRESNHVKEDEPELMKVFARRSLKLKETDAVEDMLLEAVKSRDSDKENEDSNSSLEERPRKKDESEVPSKPAFVKFQRSVSHDMPLTSNSIEKRQRCKSTPYDMEKCEQTTENSVEVVTVSEEKPVALPFKRIQQRREEWEKRAQQAMKVRGTK